MDPTICEAPRKNRGPKALGPSPPERRPNQRHGLSTLKRAVKELGSRAIDGRTGLGKALARWRADLIADLGGRDAVTTQQAAIVELAVKSKLLLDSIDAWLLVQPSLVNKRRRTLWPVVRERTQLADALARYLGQLGLERRAARVPSLQEYLEGRAGETGPEPVEAPPPRSEEPPA